MRFVGFSAHSVEAALAMMDRMRFDSVLFPVNFVLYAKGDFGPRVLEKASQLNVARLAVKAMALGPWSRHEKHDYPNCWYRPAVDPELARQAFRFALSEDVTAVLPPGDPRRSGWLCVLRRTMPRCRQPSARHFWRARAGFQPLFRPRRGEVRLIIPAATWPLR